jgi:hypothetical protein
MTPSDAPKFDVLAEVRRLVGEGHWHIDDHAVARMRERGITSPEIEYVLETGFHEIGKDQYVSGETRHAIRGKTKDGKELRLPVVFEGDLFVVTAIDLTSSPDRD